MRFLADHNLEGPVISRLREQGYAVLAMAELAPRVPDARVLELAEREHRVLVTNDKDFAELAFLQRKATVGIVMLRMPAASSREKAERLLEVIEPLGERICGALTVVEPNAARRRAFPQRP